MYLTRLAALLLAAAVGSCGSSSDPGGAPRAQDDACAIFAERPGWQEATRAAALRWGVPVELQLAIIWRESSFRAAVRPPNTYAMGVIPTGRPSTAFGYAQAIDGTWEWYVRETGNRDADRTDFADAADFVGWYASRTMKVNEIGPFDAYNHYLAYHEGHTGFRKGTWRDKAWLQDAARAVAAQAARYRGQITACPELT
ncbi:transglycosylase SLT domain-containing protein [Paralimibaculum aggregatum]|uniref:Transglycosylase SLT domain-containing protein n=1 Tax=Paralimibaculum aggregatum TaxID=3036245 RepID=A0ABQ6LQD2_9RHOB|nr:transglycosylase SLT domain-containing protein [Limibaculum sp. NKW23]GMG84770.1 transglycosylase SLT domain-containing protein [Limibaculum sp. NKW23]